MEEQMNICLYNKNQQYFNVIITTCKLVEGWKVLCVFLPQMFISCITVAFLKSSLKSFTALHSQLKSYFNSAKIYWGLLFSSMLEMNHLASDNCTSGCPACWCCFLAVLSHAATLKPFYSVPLLQHHYQ